MSRRLERERRTVVAMIRLYCRGRHGSRGPLCEDCRELEQYALGRLDRCPFGEDKTVCAVCEVHCYKKSRREQIRDVMRYAGPRLIWRHPLLSLLHLVDGRKAQHNKADAGTGPAAR